MGFEVIVEKLGLGTQQWVTNAFSWMVGEKVSYLHKLLNSLKNLCKFIQWRSSFFFIFMFFFAAAKFFKEHEKNNEFSTNSRDCVRGLRQRMLNLALMVINEVLMEKSLITHIIFRLIFFPFHWVFWSTKHEAGICSVCLWRERKNFPIFSRR